MRESLAAAWFLPCVVACGDAPEPRLSDLQARVLTPTCATAKCHAPPTLEGGLDLRAGHAHASLVGVAAKNVGAAERGLLRVKPGDPAASLLVMKLQERVDLELGVRMPWGRAALEAETVGAIAEWIARGAKDD